MSKPLYINALMIGAILGGALGYIWGARYGWHMRVDYEAQQCALYARCFTK